MVNPIEALKRGGHKHPQQILEDLAREGYKVVPIDESEKVMTPVRNLMKRFTDLK